MKNEDQSLPV